MQRKRDSLSFQPFTSFQPVFITFKLFHFKKKTLSVLNQKYLDTSSSCPAFGQSVNTGNLFSAQHADPKKFVLVFGCMFKHKPTSS